MSDKHQQPQLHTWEFYGRGIRAVACQCGTCGKPATGWYSPTLGRSTYHCAEHAPFTVDVNTTFHITAQ
jgi:hypothetical protein